MSKGKEAVLMIGIILASLVFLWGYSNFVEWMQPCPRAAEDRGCL